MQRNIFQFLLSGKRQVTSKIYAENKTDERIFDKNHIHRQIGHGKKIIHIR